MRLRKWKTWGMTTPMLFSRTIIVSRYLWVVCNLVRVPLMLDDQAINLSSGKEIKRHMVYKSQPRRVFSLYRTFYAMGLVSETISFL